MESTESFFETTTYSMSTIDDEYLTSSTESTQEAFTSTTVEIVTEMSTSILNEMKITDEAALIRFSLIDYVVFGIMLALSGDI